MAAPRRLLVGPSALLTIALMVTGVSCGQAPQSSANSPNRVVVANGLTVLLYPVPGADRVAAESLYRVGFLHEPENMTQAAHLLEHLVCQGATSTYQTGEAMRLLNQKGMANAETLPHFTHFDYMLPAEHLELALQVERERLRSLEITPDLIRQEAPKCYSEADFVERNPSAGMLKHAFMALNQAWRHGASTAQVRGGLEDIPVADLEQFHRASYDPRNLVLVVIGGFERDEALQLVSKHLGTISPPDTSPPQPVPWAQVPERMTVQWDSNVRAVSLAFPPPDDPTERFILSIWGSLLMQELMTDEQVQGAVDAVFSSNQLWNVGTLPFFVYATPSAGVTLAELQRLLATRLHGMIAQKPSAAQMQQLRMVADQFAREPELNWSAVRRQADSLASQRGLDPQLAAAMVMGNMAIQLGLRDLLLGPDSASQVEALRNLTADDLHRLLQRTLDPSKQLVVILTPIEEAP